MRGGVTDAGQRTTNEQTLKIELLSQWKMEAEFRNFFLKGLHSIQSFIQFKENNFHSFKKLYCAEQQSTVWCATNRNYKNIRLSYFAMGALQTHQLHQ